MTYVTHKYHTLIMAVVFSVAGMGCQSGNQGEDSAEDKGVTREGEKPTGLVEALASRKQRSEAKATPEKRSLTTLALGDITQSGMLQSALNVGDKAPDFTLRNQHDQSVSLYHELKNGPVILTWYRGGWCPYCNLTLQFMQSRLPDFKAAGASLMALTPELPDSSLNTAEKHDLAFQVLSDVGNGVADKFGIVYKLIPKMAEKYTRAVKLHEVNGDDSNRLPLAATYVIDQKGTIRYAFLDADYRNRADPDKIILQLKKLSAD